MLKQIRSKNEINIFGFLRHIRTQRNFLVQTEEQYIFIHDALLEVIESGETNIHKDHITKYLCALQTNTSDGNLNEAWKTLERQFQVSHTKPTYRFKMITIYIFFSVGY